MEFDINSYNFEEDSKFQDFFKKRKGDKWLKPQAFLRVLNSCKRDWINILNSATLRHSRGLPRDWGFDLIIQ